MASNASRSWLCTLNNPDEEAEVYLTNYFQRNRLVYLNGQLERGAEGTLHIQFYIVFAQVARPSKLKKLDPRTHNSIVRRDNGASSYCLKEDTRVEGPWEFGIKPIQRNSKIDWQEVKGHAQTGQLDKLPPDIFIKHYANLTKIAKDYQQRGPDCEKTRGIWIWGESGVGKSSMARRDYAPDGVYYRKLRNKWFDGYQGERVIIMDDLDKTHTMFGGFLKDWADHYGIAGETKGGVVQLKHELFIVTSQYTIDTIWREDQETIDALRRRFKVIHISDPFKVL